MISPGSFIVSGVLFMIISGVENIGHGRLKMELRLHPSNPRADLIFPALKRWATEKNPAAQAEIGGRFSGVVLSSLGVHAVEYNATKSMIKSGLRTFYQFARVAPSSGPPVLSVSMNAKSHGSASLTTFTTSALSPRCSFTSAMHGPYP